MVLPENHFFLTSCSDISKLAKPIIDALNIKRFSFTKFYADGRLITLTTCPKCLDVGYREKIFSLVKHYREQVAFERKKIILMEKDDLYFKDICCMQYDKEKVDCNNHISFVENFDDYIEIVHFNMQKTHNEPDPTIYFTNIDFIEKFIQYFKNCAMPIIIEAEKHAIYVGDNNTSSHSVNSFCFPQEYCRLNIFRKNKCITLSEQETICCALILQGMSYSRTAKIMNLSTRTVESYVNNVRTKTNCKSKQDLLEMLSVYRKFLDIVLIESKKNKFIATDIG